MARKVRKTFWFEEGLNGTKLLFSELLLWAGENGWSVNTELSRSIAGVAFIVLERTEE